jgi:hypothetical protein
MYYVFINAQVIKHMTSSLVCILRVHLFPSMWEYGHHFHTKHVDDGHITQDFGVEVEFNQSSRASHRDQNLIQRTLGYIGKIKKIMQVDFTSFQCVIFSCKWWNTFD